MSREDLRAEASQVVTVLTGVAMGASMLLLYALALAWDPLDRRMGFYARRRAARLDARELATGRSVL